ncbi:MAG TPA: hypothetical protein VGE98_06310 [Thermoanaerobaculia bacterium]
MTAAAPAAMGVSPAFLKAVIKERRVDASLPPSGWCDLVPELLAYERRRARTATRIALAAGALVLLGIGSCIAGKSSDVGALVGLGWGLLVAAIVIGALRTRLSGGTKLPAADLAACLKPLVVLLSHDVEPRTPLRLRLDLHPPLDGGKTIAPMHTLPKPYKNPRHQKVEERLVRFDRFAGSARLRTGGDVRWQVVDLIRERKIRKRGSSGKIKFQTKHKGKRRIEVRLSLRAESAPPEGAQPPLPPGVRLRRNERRVIVRARSARAFDGLPPALELNEVLDLMTAAFKPVRRGARRGAPHASV